MGTINEEDKRVVDEIKEEIDKKNKIIEVRLEDRSYLRYLNNIRKGNWIIYVPEYEDRLRNKVSNLRKANATKEKENRRIDNMEKRRVLVRLTKDYQVVEVECDGIETENDFYIEKEWALQEARALLNQLPTQDKTPQRQQSKPAYQNNTRSQERSGTTSGTVTLRDITTRHGSDKQKGFLVQAINKGFATLDEVNNADSYNVISDIIKDFFANSKR